MWVYIFVNIAAAILFYWLARVVRLRVRRRCIFRHRTDIWADQLHAAQEEPEGEEGRTGRDVDLTATVAPINPREEDLVAAVRARCTSAPLPFQHIQTLSSRLDLPIESSFS